MQQIISECKENDLQYLTFKPWQKKLNHNFSVFLGCQLLTKTNATKFLGVYIDEHLT